MKLLIAALYTLVLLAVSASSSLADEPPPLWKGDVELSYLDTGGNTNSQTFLIAGKVEHLLAHAKVSGEFAALYGEKSGVASDKNWMGKLTYDRYVTDRLFAYASEAVDRDVLKGIEIRYSSQGGLGYEFFKTSKDLLKGDVGAGYVHENPIALFPDRGFPVVRVFRRSDGMAMTKRDTEGA